MYLSTSTDCLDQVGIIEEEGSGQSDAVRVVGCSILQGHIQALHCILWDGALALTPAVNIIKLIKLGLGDRADHQIDQIGTKGCGKHLHNIVQLQ